MEGKIKVAEHFFSLQGEGHSIGVPAVFLRLSGCGGTCTWCDTVEVWKKGIWLDYDELDALFRNSGYYTRMRKGAHLVVTGGDPMLQQGKLNEMFQRMQEFGEHPESMMIEVETQAMIAPEPEFARWVRQWNISPKLANSGMTLEKRENAEALRILGRSSSAYYKFPVRPVQADLDEVDHFVRKYRLHRNRVFLMPICSSREEHQEASLKVAEMAKVSCYRYSPRLQLALWNQATGV